LSASGSASTAAVTASERHGTGGANEETSGTQEYSYSCTYEVKLPGHVRSTARVERYMYGWVSWLQLATIQLQ
jgi:hypothetical protein